MKSKKGILVSLLASIPLLFMSGCDIVVFQPQGPAARDILGLINWSLVWMLVIVVVVFALFGFILWKYRDRPEKKDYEPPEEHGSTVLEIIWTAIPILIIVALTVPTVSTIAKLDKVPQGYENKKPIVINVTSADWKWIFSYPEQGIETVNYVKIPAGTPVQFKLTSAGTMQSFWVPALGGQKYAMNKMEMQLYLVADRPGDYLGRNTNFNGKGYADMEFEVEAQTQADFDKWVQEAKNTAPKLSEAKYAELLKPTHLGRLTYSSTHLGYAQPANDPELYRVHGYPGQTFQPPANTEHNNSMNNMTNMDNMNHGTDGGEHSGH